MVMLSGRVYLVTGGGGGIGAATGRVLTERGAAVALADLDGETARRAASQIPRAIGLQCDITDAASVAEAIEQTVTHFGRLDGAVSNAGTVHLDTAWDLTPEQWQRELEVNVTGTFITARQVGEHLRSAGGGAIVNVASNCGKVGYANMAAYNASKAAVISMTRSLAMEWAKDGINVNAVCPGGVDTPMLANVAEWLAPRLDAEPEELLAGMGPAQLGRRVRPEEVGAVIAFLLSDDATIIRGQAINVDAGDTPY
ncbi:MAG TPA: SDR family NAD(P)-dependent oxidoreductase [Acidimicrobiia bacterium]|nr:SDR family NAD(P)-dependent oxidoreductase [Acidimicrobiia bacterium]